MLSIWCDKRIKYLIALYGKYLSQFETLLILLKGSKHLIFHLTHLSFQLVVCIFSELSIWNDDCVSNQSCASPANSGEGSFQGNLLADRVYPMFPWWRQKGRFYFLWFLWFSVFSWFSVKRFIFIRNNGFMVLNVSEETSNSGNCEESVNPCHYIVVCVRRDGTAQVLS